MAEGRSIFTIPIQSLQNFRELFHLEVKRVGIW